MILTITCNPALDYVMRLPALQTGAVNRSEGEILIAGGKGINVSVVLRRLGLDSTASGFLAGFVGEEILRRCAAEGINTDFVRADGCSRINVKLRAGLETDINAAGPEISEDAYDCLLQKLSALQGKDVAVFAGSAPPSLSEEKYAALMRRACSARLAVDASGSLLRRAVQMRPWLIKPNREELCGLFGRKGATLSEVRQMARELYGSGVKNVLVSLGAEGAFLCGESGREYFMPAYAGDAVDSVGAGDSMLAGFLAGWESGFGEEESLRLGAAAGAATAFCVGLASRDAILQLFEKKDRT